MTQQEQTMAERTAVEMPTWTTKGMRYYHRALFRCDLPKLKLCVWRWKRGHGTPGDRWSFYVERVNTHCSGGQTTESAVKLAAIRLARRLTAESLADARGPDLVAWLATAAAIDALEECTLWGAFEPTPA